MKKLLCIIACLLLFAGALAENTAVKTVAPLPQPIDQEHLDSLTCPAAFEGDVTVDEDGRAVLPVRLFTEDVYDIVDISTLAVGDTIVVNGAEIAVASLESADGRLIINGGPDSENGAALTVREDTNGWFYCGAHGESAYTEQCEAALPLSEDVVFSDLSDPASPVSARGADVPAALQAAASRPFEPSDSVVQIEAGQIVAITRGAAPVASPWAGEWDDEVSQRAVLDIRPDGEGFTAMVYWGSSADEKTMWCMNAVPDGSRLVYENGQKMNMTFFDGEGAEDSPAVTVEWEGSRGSFTLTDDGKILWEDDREEAAASCRFAFSFAIEEE